MTCLVVISSAMTETIRDQARTIMSNLDGIKDGNIVDLERGIYNWCVDFCTSTNGFRKNSLEDFEKVYNDKFQSVMIYLEDNATIRTKFNMNQIQGRELAYFQAFEWNPECWQVTLSEKLKRETTSTGLEQSTTDLFKCGKCKQRKTSYYEMQIRSADESATIFITCLTPKCKNEWRIG